MGQNARCGRLTFLKEFALFTLTVINPQTVHLNTFYQQAINLLILFCDKQTFKIN